MSVNSEKHFAAIRFKLNPQRDMILRALDAVKQFIIDRNDILVGGMAVDGAMRLRGLKLYEDDALADYDFYSPDHAGDAYLLGSQLCTAGFPTVDVITAIHTTTMKVRVDGNVVADITYMPLEVFKRLRTLEFKGMRLIHPWMIMMDQFRSLSTPYENPPNEVVFDRWNKDVDRLNLLLSAYTLGDQTAVKMPAAITVKVPMLIHEEGILQGWAALAIYERGKPEIPKELELPVDYCSVMSQDIDRWIELGQKGKKKVKFFSPLFSYARHIRADGVEVFDTWGERVTVDEQNVKVASLTSVMFYFFHTWLLRGDELSVEGIRRCEKVITSRSGFSLSVQPFGTHSWNTSSLYSIANILDHDRVKNWKPQTQNFPTDDCKVRRTFDPEQSPLFAIDERECESFTSIVDVNQLTLA